MVPTEAPRMLADDIAVLPDDDALGIDVDSTGRPTALAITEYLLPSKLTRQVLDTEATVARKQSKVPRYGISAARSASNTSKTVFSF